jgi:ankyrin repeat protein
MTTFLACLVLSVLSQPTQIIQHKVTCPAPYYGMGNGDGVLDRRCFNLQSQLSLAAFRGQVTKIKQLLRRGANADSYAGDRLPPLYWAASEGHTTAARLLLDNGAKPNRKYSLNGTPLFGAVYDNHVSMVALLISRGADVNIRNGDETCLKIARSKGYTEIVSLLRNAGARD